MHSRCVHMMCSSSLTHFWISLGLLQNLFFVTNIFAMLFGSYECSCILQPLLYAAEYWVFICEFWKPTRVFLNHWLCSPFTVSVNEMAVFIYGLPVLHHSFHGHSSWTIRQGNIVFPWCLNANYLPADGCTHWAQVEMLCRTGGCSVTVKILTSLVKYSFFGLCPLSSFFKSKEKLLH